MAYDDGYYYGQARLICLATSATYNEKKVTIKDGTNTWSGVISNQQVEFILPGRARYTVSVPGYEREIELSYGECYALYLDKNMDLVHFSDLEAYVKFTDLVSWDDIISDKFDPDKNGIKAGAIRQFYDLFLSFRRDVYDKFSDIDKIVLDMDSLMKIINSLKVSVETNTTNIKTNKLNIDAIKAKIKEMEKNFQDGVNTIYNAIVKKGVTPKDKTPSACADAILSLSLGEGLTIMGIDFVVAGSDYIPYASTVISCKNNGRKTIKVDPRTNVTGKVFGSHTPFKWGGMAWDSRPNGVELGNWGSKEINISTYEYIAIYWGISTDQYQETMKIYPMGGFPTDGYKTITTT